MASSKTSQWKRIPPFSTPIFFASWGKGKWDNIIYVVNELLCYA